MTVALVAAARNEGPYLLEWIAWHGLIGFDPVIVYDNGSTDQTTEVLARLAAIGAVEHVRWTVPRRQAPQQSAYADAVRRRHEGWMAFFDFDEYLLLHQDPDVSQFVAQVGAGAAGIAVAWRTFGTGGAERFDPAPTIERFVRCGRAEWRVNDHVKSIVRAEAVIEMKVHGARLTGPYVNDLGAPVELENDAFVRPRSAARAQLNHYVLRSREELAVKLRRGDGSRAARGGEIRLRLEPERFIAAHDRNEALDEAMLPLAPALRQRMEEMRRAAGIAPDLLTLAPVAVG